VATSTSVGGTFSLTGSVLGQPTVITGTITCDEVQAITSDGITLSGTIAPTGDAISGTYTLRTPADNGTFDIEKVDLARQLDSANQKITFLETQLRSSEEEVAFLRSQIEAPLEIKAGGVKHLPDFLATHECDTTPDFEQKLA